MMKSLTVRAITVFLGVAAVSGAAGLVALSPTTTQATAADTVLENVKSGSKIGSVVVTGKLVHDASSKSGWAMLVTAENTSDQPQEAPVEMDVTRSTTNPMARVGSVDSVAWKKSDRVKLAAKQKLTKKYPIPDALAAQLSANERTEIARKKAEDAAKQPGSKPGRNEVASAPRSFSTYAVSVRKGSS